MMNRFNHLPTLKIDTSDKIPFTYKGKTYYGTKGDTIATALYANGVRIYARSLKYHRPRGLYSMDGECSNTMHGSQRHPQCPHRDHGPEIRNGGQGAECQRLC
ncbi:MAG: 2Fe-2S iron-sulfur cluster-binding protein [Desulfotignum sp.]|nr:2Fe-2S iron-sulfur cluster-binding protein [Desulfotignum sp.]